MNWLLGNKTKTNVSSQTNLQAHRAKQIDSLKKANLNPIETIPNTEFRVTVQCSGNNITLVISLPPQFPQDPPTVSVQTPVYHPWVDMQQKVVGCPNLNSFSMHSSLGQTVQSIVEEFKRNPPQLTSQGYIPYSNPGPMPYQGYGNPGAISGYAAPPTLPPVNTTAPTTENRPQPTENTETQATGIPDIDVAFPELKTKSLSELNEMLNEEDKILEMIQKLPEVCRLSEDREKLSNECISLARENLAKKPSIVQLKQWIAEKNCVFEKMRDEFERDQERLMSSSDQFHPTNIQTNLKVSLLEAEEESENIVDSFLDKKMTLDEFMQKFMQARMLCHTRRAKEEKLHQIILRQGYN